MEKNLLINVPAEASSCSCCSSTRQDSPTEKVVDPVCGMSIDPATAKATSTHQGRTYYFCAEGCRQAFDKAPSSFLS